VGDVSLEVRVHGDDDLVDAADVVVDHVSDATTVLIGPRHCQRSRSMVQLQGRVSVSAVAGGFASLSFVEIILRIDDQ